MTYGERAPGLYSVKSYSQIKTMDNFTFFPNTPNNQGSCTLSEFTGSDQDKVKIAINVLNQNSNIIFLLLRPSRLWSAKTRLPTECHNKRITEGQQAHQALSSLLMGFKKIIPRSCFTQVPPIDEESALSFSSLTE